MTKLVSKPKAPPPPAPPAPAPAATTTNPASVPTADSAKASVQAKQDAASVAKNEPPTTVNTDPAKAQQQNDDTINRRRGRASTILTGPKGDASTPSLGIRALLGY